MHACLLHFLVLLTTWLITCLCPQAPGIWPHHGIFKVPKINNYSVYGYCCSGQYSQNYIVDFVYIWYVHVPQLQKNGTFMVTLNSQRWNVEPRNTYWGDGCHGTGLV